MTPPLNRLLNYALMLLGCAVATPLHAASESPQRLRYIIETDAGGDPDDEQSLVRFLLYANEWNVEGIIANRPVARRGENLNTERTGVGIVRRVVRAYGECYTNLVQHDSRYPSPERLLRGTVPGYEDAEEGVNLIMAAVDRDDPRPVWFSNWGTDHGSGPSCLKRALDKVLRVRGPDGYARFKSRIRLSSADAFGEHTTKLEPAWNLWVDTFRPELDGKRWYHRFSALTAKAGGFDIESDARTGHGPLGTMYPTNTTHPQKEGDTMSFLYLVPTSLSDPNEPGWGGWAGRYGPMPKRSPNTYFWANQEDAWQGTTNRDNTLRRWAVHMQDDFKARLDWCVKPFDKANHPPQVMLNGARAMTPLRMDVEAGADIHFEAAGSTDPDGNALTFEWSVYSEPGTYRGPLALQSTNTLATLRVPRGAAGRTIHVLLAVTDNGQPSLTRYGRVVLSCRKPENPSDVIAPFFQPPPAFSNQFGAYRSPLQFNHGTMVRRAEEWPRRRAEIARTWQDLMGPWPAVIEHPHVDILSRTNRENFTQVRVRVQIAPQQTGDGWLLVPEGKGPFPAVLVVYYEPETSVGLSKEPLRDFGYQLARRGFVTLSIGTPGGNAWRPETGSASCQPLSFHAYVAANCWHALANMPDVDAGRIGVVGHSYGGKWAMFAAALWDRFAAVAVSDPGIVFDETRPNVNYWEPWYLGYDPDHKRPKAGVPGPDNPRTGPYKKMIETGRDLHELHALIAPRPFLVSGGSEDPIERWTALNHLVALNRLLGYKNRVAMTTRPAHSPTDESNRQLYGFFEHFLKPAAPIHETNNPPQS